MFCLSCGIPRTAIAQSDVPSEPAGYFLGAFVRDGSVQVVSADFYREDDSLWVETSIPDWVYYGAYRQHVSRDEYGRFLFRTVYGEAELTFDAPYQELIGHVRTHDPPIRLHLKRNLRTPVPAIVREEILVTAADGTRLSGTLVLPVGPGPHPIIVYARGRGCQTRGTALDRAILLARYGVGGFAYDKRGGGKSEGECGAVTFQHTVGDLLSAVEILAARSEVDADKIGVWGTSAGGWVAIRAAASSPIPLAFVITLYGPSTSVEGQQKDNMRAIAEQLELPSDALDEGLAYIDLMFANRADKIAQFHEMQELIAKGEASGWAGPFLVRSREISDVPYSAAGIDSLWVQRYEYNPAPDLRRITVPFLALFGENDRVVPAGINRRVLEELLYEAGNESFRIEVMPVVGHGVEHGHRLRQLRGGPGRMDVYYWKFDRVTAGFMESVIAFLQEYGFADQQ